jgi:hypothetical protein
LILRGRVRAASAWLAAAGGAILGSLAGVAFAARVEPLLGLRSGALNGYLIPLVGLVVLPGLLQSLVLRPSVRVGGWWLLARGLAAIVMYLGFAGAYWTVNLVSGHPGHHYAPADGEVAICSTVAGVAFGLVSGAALGRLLRHGSRRSGERRAGRPAQV